MKIIYYDSTGQYLSVIAAAFHLNMLSSSSKIPEWNKLKELPYFDKSKQVKLGKVIFVGTDQLGNDIYILGSGKVGDVIERVIQGLSRIFELEKETIFINLTENEDWRIKWGLRFKRLFPNLSLSNRLIYNNLIDAFLEIVDKANEIKKD